MRYSALRFAYVAAAIAAAPMATAFAQSGTAIPNLPESTWKLDRPIEFVVQAAAGGGSDLFARTMANILAKDGIVSVPVNVVNKPGGSGAVAYAYMSKKRGDPHVIATATSSYLTTPIQGHSPVTYKDFTNTAVLCVEDYVGVVRTESPYKTLKDLVEAHPPTTEQRKRGASYNIDTFAPALVAACSLEPRLTFEQAKELKDSPDWSGGEFGDIYGRAMAVCNAGLDIPFNARD